MSQVPAGMSKVFILDKYFNELQKFWDTEKRLKGKQSQIIFFSLVWVFERSENREAFLPSEAINVYSLESTKLTQLWTPKDFFSYERGFNDFS